MAMTADFTTFDKLVMTFGGLEQMCLPQVLNLIRLAMYLHGTRNGLTIDAKWQDVPLGDTKSKGDISLTIAPTGEKITKNSASGGFGGNSWIKKCDQIAKSKLPTDVILAESDTGIIPTPKGNFNDNMVDSSNTGDSEIESNIRNNVIAK